MKLNKSIVFAVITLLLGITFTNTSFASTATVTTDTLNLREEASTDSTALKLLNSGDKLEVIEEKEEWVKVKTTNGTLGYVYKEYVDIKDNEQENIIKDDEKSVPEENVQENIQENVTKNKLEVKELTLKNEVDLYILPLLNSTKLEKVQKNTNITIMEETNNWLYVETENYNGWVIKSFVIADENETNQEEQNNKVDETTIDKKVMYVNYSSIYVRQEPSTSAEVVDTLILNNQVNVIAEAGDWYKVEVDGKEGYIAKRLLSNSKQEEEEATRNARERQLTDREQAEVNNAVSNSTSNTIGEEIAEFAKQYLGCPYVYGGSGPSSFDCSGFTMYVYKNFGIRLSHSATAQSKNGVYVAKEDLQPGDLVFFKDYETMNGIGHVGIYIGNGDFIHASSGTGYCVKVSTLLSGSYLNRYETARRLV